MYLQRNEKHGCVDLQRQQKHCVNTCHSGATDKCLLFSYQSPHSLFWGNSCSAGFTVCEFVVAVFSVLWRSSSVICREQDVHVRFCV